MKQEKLQAIRERCEKATSGPWEVSLDGINVSVVAGDENYAVCETNNYNIDQLNDADPEFIAHARTDIPALLDEIERLRGLSWALVKDVITDKP